MLTGGATPDSCAAYEVETFLQEVWYSVSGRHHGAVLLGLREILYFPVQLVIEAQYAGDIPTPA